MPVPSSEVGRGKERRAGDPADPYGHLSTVDPVLRDLVHRHGRPDPFVWPAVDDSPATNFSALVLHVVSQQISTAVALTLFRRVEHAAGGPLDPQRVAGLGAARLHELGLSRAKAAAVVEVADKHLAGTLDTAQLDALTDDAAVAALTAARGVGPWTAQMFLIHQLRRPDVLPAGDLGIRHAVQAAWALPALPRVGEVQDRGRPWAPCRTYAAALLWASRRSGAAPEDPTVTGTARS
jgi:DNA-3-methyladenine glycosylase II